MTARLVLESPRGSIDLDGIAKHGVGVQAQAGLSGLGLPARDVQFGDGAGDGARYRSTRILPRDIDMPLHFEGRDREHLKELLGHFSRVVNGECTLRFLDDAETGSWTVQVHLVGGGQYVYGIDTIGEESLSTVITLRAGDPFWTRSYEEAQIVGQAVGGVGLLNGSLANLHLAASQTEGSMTLLNDGDADAFPVWQVTGPGTGFEAVDPISGRSLRWDGLLLAGEVLTIDTATGSVTDNNGVNRYPDLAAAPLFWRIPPGSHTTQVSLNDTTSASRIKCLWRPRKWLVI